MEQATRSYTRFQGKKIRPKNVSVIENILKSEDSTFHHVDTCTAGSEVKSSKKVKWISLD